MFALRDILELLDKWPKWKRVQEAPDRIDELEKQVAALEERLQRAPGEACPKCGALEYRVSKSKAVPSTLSEHFPPVTVRTMKCKACGFKEDQRMTGKAK